MRRRATRPNVFRGLKRFGVYSTDWKYILVPTGAAYIVPFIFGLWFGYVPLGFPLGLFTFLILLGTFNNLRLSKPQCWAIPEIRRVCRPMEKMTSAAIEHR